MSTTTLTPPLGGAVPRVLLALFVAVHLLLAVGAGPTPVPIRVLALAAMVAAAALVLGGPAARLPRGRALATGSLAAGAVAAIVPVLPGGGWPGYASWPLGAGTFVAIGLAIRDRIAIAWALLGAMAACALLWGATSGDGVAAGVGLVDRQAGVLLIGTLFAIALRRARAATDAFAARSRERLRERSRGEQESRARAAAAASVLAAAGPSLHRIASAEPLTDDDRGRLLALEGRLRDRIALSPVLTEVLEASLAHARAAGMDVVVLVGRDVDALQPDSRRRAGAWIADRLLHARGDRFVGRIALNGADLQVSASVDGAVDHDSIRLDAEEDSHHAPRHRKGSPVPRIRPPGNP